MLCYIVDAYPSLSFMCECTCGTNLLHTVCNNKRGIFGVNDMKKITSIIIKINVTLLFPFRFKVRCLLLREGCGFKLFFVSSDFH